jgi:hypothetical protein
LSLHDAVLLLESPMVPKEAVVVHPPQVRISRPRERRDRAHVNAKIAAM